MADSLPLTLQVVAAALPTVGRGTAGARAGAIGSDPRGSMLKAPLRVSGPCPVTRGSRGWLVCLGGLQGPPRGPERSALAALVPRRGCDRALVPARKHRLDKRGAGHLGSGFELLQSLATIDQEASKVRSK